MNKIIYLKSPRRVLLSRGMVLEYDISPEQTARIIEKALLSHGIICESIEVIK